MESQVPKTVSPLEAILGIIVTFFLAIFLGAAILLFMGMEQGYGPTLVIGELIILLVPLIFMLFKHVNIRSFARVDLKPKFVVAGLASGFALLALNIAVSTLLTSVFGSSPTVEEANANLLKTAGTNIGLILVATSLILAGVCEEFAFRGFLQSALTRGVPRKYGAVAAILLSSLAFGIFHFDPYWVYTLSAFISGLALGLIYYRWGYVASATAHATMNMLVLALLLLGL